MRTIYDFAVKDRKGKPVALKEYANEVILIVNTATKCGFTPQYEELEKLYEKYHSEGFTILDFPCNQFGGQAPGSYDVIHEYCTSTYNITFPQFAKIDVKGPNASPLYVWLKEKKPGEIPWNFTKFLIDRKGNVVGRYDAQTSSMTTVERAIRAQL